MNKFIFSLLTLLMFACQSFGDEIRMAYLNLDESTKDRFSVLFKVPLSKAGRKLDLKLNLPNSCKNITPVKSQLMSKAYINTWQIECDGGLLGQKISVDGLLRTNTDMLFEMKPLDLATKTTIITTNNPSYIIPNEDSSMQVITTYTSLGIIHILEGFDHLLFVFALLLIVKNIRQLIWTITAFTLAHSITLAGASLGYLSLPQQPVEAIIALSIVFLAMEVIHKRRGITGIASKAPWIVAFAFGLLHGFGFAGALSEIGLPENDVPLALLFFNVGVELGQLIFVCVVLLISFVLKQLRQEFIFEKGQLVITYFIGGLSSFWLIERVSGF